MFTTLKTRSQSPSPLPLAVAATGLLSVTSFVFSKFHVNAVIQYESFVSDLFSLNTLETQLCHWQVSVSVVHSFLVHRLAVSLGFGYCMF